MSLGAKTLGMQTTPLRLGMDLGGTKIEAALLDADGSIRWKKRIASPQHDYTATLAALKTLVVDARSDVAEAKACTIGIGIPGSLSPADGRVRNANATWLNGKPLKDDLESLLGQSVRMANDANCLAVSEFTDGAAKEAQSVFAVILGTGVGGAHVLHGQLVVGANGIAGEWGHVPLPWMNAREMDHPACWCGRTGCIETFLSGPVLVREFHHQRHVVAENTLLSTAASAPGEPVHGVEGILRAVAVGDACAIAIMDRFHDRLARALAMVITIVDPEVIVVGGGLSNITSIYSEIPKRWARWIFSDVPAVTRIVPALHGDASGVRGAAWL